MNLVGFCCQIEFFGWVTILAGKLSPNQIVTGISNGALGSIDVLCQKFTKEDKETLQKLLALKKQADASQRS